MDQKKTERKDRDRRDTCVRHDSAGEEASAVVVE